MGRLLMDAQIISKNKRGAMVVIHETLPNGKKSSVTKHLYRDKNGGYVDNDGNKYKVKG